MLVSVVAHGELDCNLIGLGTLRDPPIGPELYLHDVNHVGWERSPIFVALVRDANVGHSQPHSWCHPDPARSGFQLLVDKRALLKADSHWSAPPEKADDQEVALIQAVSTCETVKTGLHPRPNGRRTEKVCLFLLLHI